MRVYHGSDSNFKTLKISKSLVRHQSTLDNEGIGIYFSTDYAIADSYGKYVYELEVNDAYFSDFRIQLVCRRYVDFVMGKVLKETGVNVRPYINSVLVVQYLYNGGIAVSGVGKEIKLCLDSNEDWYKLSQSKIQKVYKALENCDKNCPKAYMFNYHIRNCGVIKDVSSDVVKIINKYKR